MVEQAKAYFCEGQPARRFPQAGATEKGDGLLSGGFPFEMRGLASRTESNKRGIDWEENCGRLGKYGSELAIRH